MQNAFAALHKESNKEDDDAQIVITQMAALTTQSQLTATTVPESSAAVAAAISQLAANQHAMQQQFAAFTTQRNTTYQPAQAAQPPITQFSILNFAMFPAEGREGSKRGGHGRGGRTNFTTTGGRNIRTPFANFVGRGRQGGLPPIGEECRRGSSVASFTQQNMQHNMAPMCSNITKGYANWNVCFSCGFDVKDGHTSKTCPTPWRCANHQEGYDWNNLGQYIAGGYDVCTKAIHKSQLPTM